MNLQGVIQKFFDELSYVITENFKVIMREK